MRSWRRVIATWIALMIATTIGAWAEDPPPIPDPLVRLQVESANFSPSRKALEVVLLAEIAANWHVNAHEPTSEAMIPTVLSVTPPAGFKVGDIRYPEAERRVLAFAGGEAIDVYSGSVRFSIPLSIEGELTQEGASFEATLHYQACDDTRCLRPADVQRTFLVRRPADVETREGSTGSSNQTPVDRWLERYGLAPTLLFVFVMGLGLNLTPCVYPLISVTVAYFGGQARERRGHAAALAAVYALGIALTFSLLGVSAALSGGLFGRALQQPATLIGISTVMVALALSSFGLYTLQPPAWLLQRAGGSGGRGFAGALFMGLTMGLVAAPCVGPVIVGLLVAVGARGDALLGFVLFFALALGLGSPYVALGAGAGSISRLPRAGEWLVWIERLFGFLLLGLALYFISPLLAPRLRDLTATALLLAAALTLGILDRRGPGLVGFTIAKRMVGVLALLLAAWFAVPEHPRTSSIAWLPFTPDTLESARAAGRAAVVDFRADWCLPCIEMERTTFVAPEVESRSRDFVMLQADVTEMSKDSEELLSRYGVMGVPTTLFFSPAGTERHRRVGYISAEEFSSLLDDTGAPARQDLPGSPGQSARSRK